MGADFTRGVGFLFSRLLGDFTVLNKLSERYYCVIDARARGEEKKQAPLRPRGINSANSSQPRDDKSACGMIYLRAVRE